MVFQTRTEHGNRVFKLNTFPVVFKFKGVVGINPLDISNEILSRLSRIEQRLLDGLRNVDEKLDSGKDSFQFFSDGLKAYKDRTLREVGPSGTQLVLNQWAAKIRKDKELRFPHRKILDVLLQHYDFEKQHFKELYFSKLVKEAHVGKHAAKGYLILLEQRGYVQKSDDGYRIFFKVRE